MYTVTTDVHVQAVFLRTPVSIYIYKQRNTIIMKINIKQYKIDIVIKSSIECQEGEFASHPSDCNKYLQCLWGNFKVNSCPGGLYWNNVILD